MILWNKFGDEMKLILFTEDYNLTKIQKVQADQLS